jgi:hypothetical protein
MQTWGVSRRRNAAENCLGTHSTVFVQHPCRILASMAQLMLIYYLYIYTFTREHVLVRDIWLCIVLLHVPWGIHLKSWTKSQTQTCWDGIPLFSHWPWECAPFSVQFPLMNALFHGLVVLPYPCLPRAKIQ